MCQSITHLPRPFAKGGGGKYFNPLISKLILNNRYVSTLTSEEAIMKESGMWLFSIPKGDAHAAHRSSFYVSKSLYLITVTYFNTNSLQS